jgi:hypothetical protein
LDAQVEKGASGLELRAFQDVLTRLRDAGEAEAVTAFLRANLSAASERRKTVALALVAEMKAEGLESELVTLLSGDDAALARRAAAALRASGSHAGNDVLRLWLADTQDERKVQAAIGLLVGLEAPVWEDLRPLLGDPRMGVRTLLVTALSAHVHAYAEALRTDLAAPDLGVRARRSLLDCWARTDLAPTGADLPVLRVLLEHEDWGVRADAARLARRWQKAEGADAAALGPLLDAVERLRTADPEPYVRFSATP